MKKIVSMLLISSVLLSSCTTTYQVSLKDDLSKQFVGLKHNEIVRIMGAPNRQTSDGSGGCILIFEETIQHSVATATNVNYITRTYTPSVTTGSYTNYVQFFIDKDEICYDVKTNYTKSVTEKNPKGTVWAIIGSILGVAATVGLVAVCAYSGGY